MAPIAQSWLLQSLGIFLILGSTAAIAVGVMLIFRPIPLRKIRGLLDRWVSTRRLDRSLEKRIALDPVFYRHSQLTGLLILSGALYILYFFSFAVNRVQMMEGLSRRLGYPLGAAEGILDALVMIFLTGALGAVLVSLFILFRPSLLRDFEGKANRWLSLRRSMKPLEVPRDSLDIYVERHAKQFGVFMILGGLYALVLMLMWLGR